MTWRQAAVLADHDSRVIERWRPRCSPWKLGELLDRAARKARAAGYAGVTVACEPTTCDIVSQRTDLPPSE